LAITYNAKETLRTTYVQSAMLLAVGVAPITACLVFFGQPLLLAWTGNATLVQAAALPLVLISIGTMCNAFMHVPYALQLAHGKTHLALTQNIIAIALLPPITIYSTLHYGIAGAGVSWFLLNLGYVILSAPLAHRGLLNNVSGRWYRQGIFIPLAVAILVTTPFYALSRVLALGTVFTLSMAAAGLALSVAGCALLVDRGTLSHLFAPSSGERAA
jgi:O-antigen/teichoic acid export membrane protein